MTNAIKLFAMPNSQYLGEAIAKELKINLSPMTITRFVDGEVVLQANDSVRNSNVYIIAAHIKPVHDSILELLIFIDSLKRASARSITVALTYYGYSRQDRKAIGRQPIGAKLMADLLEAAGVTKLIAVDLHNPSIQGFFDIPVDDLKAAYILAPEIHRLGRFSVVSPDHGGATRARILAELISDTIDIAIVDKRRTGANTAEVLNILGDVQNRNVVIIDDMIDTGGTIIKAAEALRHAGAKSIVVAATHGLFSRGFAALNDSSFIDRVIVTDSLSSVYAIDSPKLKVVSLAPFLAATMRASIDGSSITRVYENLRHKISKL